MFIMRVFPGVLSYYVYPINTGIFPLIDGASRPLSLFRAEQPDTGDGACQFAIRISCCHSTV